MNLNELVAKIHKAVDDLDLITARRYIEDNITILSENRSLLKGNARELLKFLTTKLESGDKMFSRAEMATINAINMYATKFDVRSIKLTIKNKEPLLLREDFESYLNSDAKIILEGLGALKKKNNEQSQQS